MSGFSCFSGRELHLLEFFPGHVRIKVISCWGGGWTGLSRGRSRGTVSSLCPPPRLLRSVGAAGLRREGQSHRKLAILSMDRRLLIPAAKPHSPELANVRFFSFFRNVFPVG